MSAARCNRCGASMSPENFFRHECPDPTKLLHGRPGASTGQLRQGYVLSTPETARWPTHMLEAANAREKCSLFAGFSEFDQGRGRQLVAMAQRQEDARRLAACWNACEGLHTESLERNKPLADQIVDVLNQREQLQVELDKLRAEFEAYREGSEEAFRSVVEQKQYLVAKADRQFETIQSQQAVIVRLRSTSNHQPLAGDTPA